jgi:RNA polymerase sigma-70 factor (sigma-E family)
MRDEAGFRAFVEANASALLHTARLLTGDHHRAEDLVQTALSKLYPRWERVDEPLAYARRTMVTSHIDARRRLWWGERPTDDLPERSDTDATVASDERDQLRRLLGELPPRERAVIVLRYYCDLSEQDTARTLKIPVGTVKSSCARALAKLRVEAVAG